MKLLILGNSGSGKSSIARQIAPKRAMAHLDLDSVAWKSDRPGEREDPQQAAASVQRFCRHHRLWVVEGCYSTLLRIASFHATHLLFLNPGIEACIANCRRRPWEPHKYPSKELQDRNLPMLLDWVATYETRADEYSLAAHRDLFETFQGVKFEWRSSEHSLPDWI